MAKSFKERYHALKSSRTGRGARAVGGFLGGPMKTLAIGAAIGGAGSYINREVIGTHLAFMNENWYGEGAVLLGEAFALVKMRRPGMAMAAAGAAGYSLEFRRALNEYQQGRRSTPPWPTFKSEIAGTGTKALQNEAGAAPEITF